MIDTVTPYEIVIIFNDVNKTSRAYKVIGYDFLGSERLTIKHPNGFLEYFNWSCIFGVKVNTPTTKPAV